MKILKTDIINSHYYLIRTTEIHQHFFNNVLGATVNVGYITNRAIFRNWKDGGISIDATRAGEY